MHRNSPQEEREKRALNTKEIAWIKAEGCENVLKQRVGSSIQWNFEKHKWE